MRTTVTIDDKLIDQAMALSGTRGNVGAAEAGFARSHRTGEREKTRPARRE